MNQVAMRKVFWYRRPVFNSGTKGSTNLHHAHKRDALQRADLLFFRSQACPCCPLYTIFLSYVFVPLCSRLCCSCCCLWLMLFFFLSLVFFFVVFVVVVDIVVFVKYQKNVHNNCTEWWLNRFESHVSCPSLYHDETQYGIIIKIIEVQNVIERNVKQAG